MLGLRADRWPVLIWTGADTAVALVRFALLGLCALLDVLEYQDAAVRDWRLGALFVIAVLATVPLPSAEARRYRPLLEAAAAAAVLATGVPFPDALLPYLIVAPLAGGLLLGATGAVAATLLAAIVLTAGGAINDTLSDRGELVLVAQWLGLGLAAGLVGAWARSLAGRSGLPDSYVAAHNLLSRLRDVARTLPSGLDEVALAQQVLTQIRTEAYCDAAALYAVTDGGVLVPLAFAGADRIGWLPTLDEGLWGRAWRSGTPVQQSGSFDDPAVGSSAVLPLRLGDRRIGLIGMQRPAPWSVRQLRTAQELADDAALRIDTGQLFSEVRALATVEERRRLAREIHDGIAQEIASVGYLVDDIAARSPDAETREELSVLRGRLSVLVDELRLSIFDLRSDVQPATGLGAALSSYVRSVATGSGLTVHLVLDESAHRLPIEAETELLRVAQEAVTNARKHARARNLWVTCRVDPPRAFLRVADDGLGLGSPRTDSFGLEIMRERTNRIGAVLALRNRVGGGTVVEVSLGPPAARPRHAVGTMVAGSTPATGPAPDDRTDTQKERMTT